MKKIDYTRITTLIFDFGGVLYQIDPERTYRELIAKSGCPEKLADKSIFTDEGTIFTDYETGNISSEHFRRNVINDFCLSVSEDEFDVLWNTLLISMYPDVLVNLKEFALNYKLLLLSNTNEIHYACFGKECEELFGLFNKLYLSFQIGLRKPKTNIFKHVLNDSALNPNECLFIDDSEINIIGAEKVGISAVLFDYTDGFKKLKNKLPIL